jgi:hypothetical protein
VPRDFPNEFFELLVGLCPLFDFRDQVHGDVDGAGLGFLLESQVPAGGGATGSLEGAEGTLQEGAYLAKAMQGSLAPSGMPVVGDGHGFHIGSIKAYCIWQAKNSVRRIKISSDQGETGKTQKVGTNHQDPPGPSTRKISNSESPLGLGMAIGAILVI